MGVKFNPFTGNLDLIDTTAAAGADTQVQYNNGGSLAGSADLTWDDTAKELGVGGDINLDDGGTYATTLQLITPTANRTISFPDATGTVALVGGSSGQLVYNNAGAYAGAPSTSVGATGDITLSLAGAASTPPVSLTGTWFSGGTSTTTKPQLLIEPNGTTSTAWSTSGTGLGVNAASGFGGRLFDFQINGSSKAVLDSSGRLLVGTSSTSQPATVVVAPKDPGACIYANTGGGATGGTASPSYGLYVEGRAWNNATVQYGVYAKQTQQLISPTYGGYFETTGLYNNNYGVYAKVLHTETGAATTAHGLFATAQGNGAGPGRTYGVFAQNTTTDTGSRSYGLGVSTAAGPTTVVPVEVNHAGGLIFRVNANGGISNFQANDVNLSDRNAKKDISPAAGTWDCIKEWEIVNYRYKDQPDDADLNLGVIAQQVAESCPEVITVFSEATEDEPEKLGVKEQQMYWMAIKALQEAQLRIETLEAKVAALESA